MKGLRIRNQLAAMLCAAMMLAQPCRVWAEALPAAETVSASLKVSASVSGDTITAVLAGNKGIPVDVILYNETGVEDTAYGVSDTATLTFTGLKNGMYSVFAEYTEGGASDFADVEVTQGKAEPTATPTAEPTATPTAEPTATPTAEPTATPTAEPTATPTAEPTATPTAEPTATPTAEPTATPTAEPTATPTAEPTATPTAEPSATPTAEPTATPTAEPTATPTAEPTATPTPAAELLKPGVNAADAQTTPTPEKTSLKVSASVSGDTITVTLSGNKGVPVDVILYNEIGVEDTAYGVSDTATLTFSGLSSGWYSAFAEYTEGGVSDFADVEVTQGKAEPTATPTAEPTATPTAEPTATPTAEPTAAPTAEPTATPTAEPVQLITPAPTAAPTGAPTATPTAVPTAAPSGQYSIEVTAAKGALYVAVRDALPQAMVVEITKPDGSTQVQVIDTGSGTASFTGLAAGVYSVYLDYAVAVKGVSPVWQEGITLLEGADVTASVSGQFEVNVGVGGTSITVQITGAKQQPVDVVLIRPDKTTDVRQLAQGNGTMTFTDLADGSYSVVAAYQTQVEGVSSVKREGLVVDAAPTAASAIVATAQAGVSRVDVSVTSASRLPVAVTLLSGGVIRAAQRIEAGVGTVSFTALAAGTYSVSVDYAPSQLNVKPCQIDGLAVAASVAKIAISSVVPGVNRLTVSGTAQPGADITITTEPAAAAVIAKADASGSFTAELVLSAGAYTAVYAQYGTDGESRVSVKGEYAVSAPAARPPIAVNPIGHKDSTVTARSNPGVIVNLGTYDYGQTVTADARGMLQYSLPHIYPDGTQITFTVYYGEGKTNSYQHVVTVGGAKTYALLKRGDKSTAVFELTSRLVELGYLIDPTTGYDDTVVAAVRQFQMNNGLAADGIAGNLTQTALYSVSAIAANEASVYPTLVRGDKGLALIYTLQQRLKDLGYYTIRVDGVYGSGTQRAVRDFQAVNGLAATGAADHATQTLLYSASAKPAGSQSADADGYAALSRSGRYDARVVPLQRRLKELGYLSGSVDGYFGSQTYRAVRNFQYRNGMTATGIADSYTQQVLYSAAAKTASGSVSGTTAQSYRLLTWGSEGEDVARLQKALLAAGYTQVRTADGIYGQWTYDAVRAFQKDHGLDVDGIAGRKTQNKLYGTSY